jgi:hypothetical protein
LGHKEQVWLVQLELLFIKAMIEVEMEVYLLQDKNIAQLKKQGDTRKKCHLQIKNHN